jgi:hypothetical protein
VVGKGRGRPSKQKPQSTGKVSQPAKKRADVLGRRVREITRQGRGRSAANLTGDEKALLLMCRDAVVRDERPDGIGTVGELEKLVGVRQGGLSRMAKQQERTGKTAPEPKSGRPSVVQKLGEDCLKDQMRGLQKSGKAIKNDCGLRWLPDRMGRSKEWTRLFRREHFKRFTVRWKPLLTADNIAKRLARSIKRVALYKTGYKPVVEDIQTNKGVIEIMDDEKWFFRGSPNAIWADPDEPPEFRHSGRVAKHQREKLMVLAVVSNMVGRAKICLVFCEKQVAAKRNSKNRRKGTLELKDRSVTAAFTIEMLKDTVYPKVEALFPEPGVVVHHQTDNARPHTAKTTLKFKADYAAAGKIIPMPDQQAPRCPESNVLDLSVFNWMQEYVDAKDVITRDQLRTAVKEAWEALPEEMVLNSFRHLPEVHAGIVERKGGNRAKSGT